MGKIENIEELVGEEISGVGFIRDYVEFYFDGPIVRSVSNPIIRLVDGEFRFPESNSRDALCKIIGESVIAVRVDENESMKMETANGITLTIPLDDDSRSNSEAMHFLARINGPIQVW